MLFELNQKTLKDALSIIGQVKHKGYVDECKVNKTASGNVVFSKWNPDLMVKYTIVNPAENCEAETISLNFDDLKTAADMIKTDGKFETNNNALTIKSKSRKIDINLVEPLEDMFYLHEQTYEPFAKMPANELLETITNVEKATSKKDAREVLLGLNFNSTNGYIGATDSYRMINRDIKKYLLTDEGVDKTINALTYAALKKALDKKNKNDVSIYYSKKYLSFLITRDDNVKIEITGKVYDGKYPNLARIVPNKFNYEYKLDTDTAVESLEGFKKIKVPKHECRTIIMSVENGNIVVSNEKDDGTLHLKDIFAYDIEDLEYREIGMLNADFLMDAISPLGNDMELKIQMQKYAPLITMCGNGYTSVVHGMRQYN